LPNCSRCAYKGIQCLYQFSGAPSNLGVQGAPVDELVPLVHQGEAALAHNGLNNFDHALSTNTWPDLQSSPETGNFNGTAFSDGMLDLISSDSLSWNLPSDAFFLPQSHHFKDRVILGSFYIVCLSPSFVPPLDTKTILEKRDLKAGPHGSALTRAYCMSTLRSYPGMLYHNDGTLPPFIHAQSPLSGWETDSECANSGTVVLPEPLAICSSIMRMCMARSPGNLAFIWRTIQAESRRIEGQVSTCILKPLKLI
jgi:hypothetical protein